MKRTDSFLKRWMPATDDAGNIMSDRLHNAILNKRSLAEKGMLSGEHLAIISTCPHVAIQCNLTAAICICTEMCCICNLMNGHQP